ncbi:AMP-binding protein [Paraburkholderia bonniea]|uniref:phenylacetate--CoA ligase family protein n=1 Tax=Paraburkholderia bonniea TaxID=2152891 RepID=UPI001290BB7C|nr:AMP-binding protein [Paraburkholderia bonniea]WJF91517.1 AMP-binding protein [Paraburkholderia bonniea]WJF94836.1 AMP-binding protein [Paraburkholderia bonniea]
MRPKPSGTALASLQTTRFNAALVNQALRYHAGYAQRLPSGVADYATFCQQVACETAVDLKQRVLRQMRSGALRGVTLHATSGTSGAAKLLLHAGADKDRQASYGRTLCDTLGGMMFAPGDTVVNLFTAGGFSLLFDGCNRMLEALGANIIPLGRLDTYGAQLQALLEWLALAQPNVLLGTPTSVLHCLEVTRAHGLVLNIEKIVFSGEAFSQARRAQVHECWPQARIFGLYGQTETGFIGYATPECDAAHYHVFDDWFFLEACEQQLLVTSWANTALPLLRYQCSDRVRLHLASRCRCGRPGARLVLGGRSDTRFNYAGNLISTEVLAARIQATLGQPVECQFVLSTSAGGGEQLCVVLDLDEAELAPWRQQITHAVSTLDEVRECLDKGQGTVRVDSRAALHDSSRQKTPLLLDLRESHGVI